MNDSFDSVVSILKIIIIFSFQKIIAGGDACDTGCYPRSLPLASDATASRSLVGETFKNECLSDFGVFGGAKQDKIWLKNV